MNERADLPPLRDVIKTLKLSANKALSQNFILDLNVTRRITRAAGPLDDKTIIEVGPGPGGLTRSLLEDNNCSIIAIERDQRCLPALEMIRECYPDRLQIILDDALKVDYTKIATASTEIVANLPYGLATILLIRWLKTESWPPWYQKMTLMFQKEVAERIVAEPGSKSYGRLSVLT
ncbi:MAG: ribosomal RNA small subunit methyltransferase A, partial [Desulfobulbia bacterium]